MVLTGEELLRGRVGQIAGGEDVRYGSASLSRDTAALGQVRLHEGAVAAAQLAERVQGLDHARALRPAAAGAGGQGNYRQHAILPGLQADRSQSPPLRPPTR